MEKNSHGGENRVESDNEKEHAENSFFYNLIWMREIYANL